MAIKKTKRPRRRMHQQPLYLEPARAEILAQLARRTRIPRQSLLREAVDDLLVKWNALPPMPSLGHSGEPAKLDGEIVGHAPVGASGSRSDQSGQFANER